MHELIRRLIEFHGRQSATAPIDRALWAAAADAFVRELPGGLDVSVGEAGARHSGGQRYRVAIAREPLRRPAANRRAERRAQGVELERLN